MKIRKTKIRNIVLGLVAVVIVSTTGIVSKTGILVSSSEAANVSGPRVSWKFSIWGNSRAFTKGAERLAERLAEETGGQFTMKVYFGESLSKAKENLDGIKLGAFESAMFCNIYTPGKNPAFMVFTLPFIPLGNWSEGLAVRHGVYKHEALRADMDRWDAMVYATTNLPQYEFVGKGKPPLELEDWKGLLVRAGGGVGLAMEKLGASRQSMPATDVYTALQRGTIDAASFPFSYAHGAFKTDEVSDWYTSNLAPGTSDCPLVFSKKAYNKLPKQYQDLLWSLRDEVVEVHRVKYAAADEKFIKRFNSRLQAIKYSEETLKRFREVAGKPVWDKWIKDNQDKFNAQEVFDLVWKLAGRKP